MKWPQERTTSKVSLGDDSINCDFLCQTFSKSRGSSACSTPFSSLKYICSFNKYCSPHHARNWTQGLLQATEPSQWSIPNHLKYFVCTCVRLVCMAHVCGCACVCARVRVEARDWHQVISTLLSVLCGRQSLSLEHRVSRQPACSGDPLCPSQIAAGPPHLPETHVDSGDQNFGPQGCETSVLPISSHLVLWDGVSGWTWILLISLSWLANELQGSGSSQLPQCPGCRN